MMLDWIKNQYIVNKAQNTKHSEFRLSLTMFLFGQWGHGAV